MGLRAPRGVPLQEWRGTILPHDPTLPPGPTLAVLLSACSFSITSELTLRKSLSTALSSCRMNSLRVSSMPCCRLRTSCNTLSRETAGRASSAGVRAGLGPPCHTRPSLVPAGATCARLVEEVQLGVEAGQLRVLLRDHPHQVVQQRLLAVRRLHLQELGESGVSPELNPTAPPHPAPGRL